MDKHPGCFLMVFPWSMSNYVQLCPTWKGWKLCQTMSNLSPYLDEKLQAKWCKTDGLQITPVEMVNQAWDRAARIASAGSRLQNGSPTGTIWNHKETRCHKSHQKWGGTSTSSWFIMVLCNDSPLILMVPSINLLQPVKQYNYVMIPPWLVDNSDTFWQSNSLPLKISFCCGRWLLSLSHGHFGNPRWTSIHPPKPGFIKDVHISI